MEKIFYLGKWYLGNRFGLSRHGFVGALALLILATYCSLSLTTNAAVDSLNQRLAQLREEAVMREQNGERAMRIAVLDAYPSLSRGERAYNASLRRGDQALTQQDRDHRRLMDDILTHYRPVMLESLRNGVHPTNMRQHMEKMIDGDYYVPAGRTQLAMRGSANLN